ncbi:MAG: hypothetical protein RL096_502, partial [Actinomycetota bacterium]
QQDLVVGCGVLGIDRAETQHDVRGGREIPDGCRH